MPGWAWTAVLLKWRKDLEQQQEEENKVGDSAGD